MDVNIQTFADSLAADNGVATTTSLFSGPEAPKDDQQEPVTTEGDKANLFSDLNTAEVGDQKGPISENDSQPKSMDIDPAETKPVIVIVGPLGKCQTFEIPKKILQDHAPYILAEQSKLSATACGIVMLIDNDPDIFARWYKHVAAEHWGDVIPHQREPTGHNLIDAFETITRLYVLCEQLQDIRTKNVIVHWCAKFWAQKAQLSPDRGLPTAAALRIIWEGTPETSPMRDLCISLWAMFGDAGDLHSNGGTPLFPWGFLSGFAKRSLKMHVRQLDMLRNGPNEFGGYPTFDIHQFAAGFWESEEH